MGPLVWPSNVQYHAGSTIAGNQMGSLWTRRDGMLENTLAEFCRLPYDNGNGGMSARQALQTVQTTGAIGSGSGL